MLKSLCVLVRTFFYVCRPIWCFVGFTLHFAMGIAVTLNKNPRNDITKMLGRVCTLFYLYFTFFAILYVKL